MTSIDFLYIALGVGFVILVIFLCVMLLNLSIVLRDVSKMTGNFKEVSERIREFVLEPVKSIAEMTSSLGFIHNIVEKIKSRFEDVEAGECTECEDGVCSACNEEVCRCDDEKISKKEEKKKGFFSVRKLGK